MSCLDEPNLERNPGSVRRQGHRELLEAVMGSEYDFGSEIGSGADSIVYQATERKTGEKRAIKHVFECERIIDAILGMRHKYPDLMHENIVEIFGVKKVGNGVAVIMERAEADLASSVKGETRLRKYRWLTDAARGLAHLHKKGIVHRDFKESNVLVVSGVAKVADIDLSCRSRSLATLHSFYPNNITPSHCPPETRGEEPRYGRAGDVFAYGVTFFNVIVNSSLSGSHAENRYSDDILRAYAEAGGLTELESELFIKCLTVNTDDRWTMDDVVDHLRVLCSPPALSISTPLQDPASDPAPKQDLTSASTQSPAGIEASSTASGAPAFVPDPTQDVTSASPYTTPPSPSQGHVPDEPTAAVGSTADVGRVVDTTRQPVSIRTWAAAVLVAACLAVVASHFLRQSHRRALDEYVVEHTNQITACATASKVDGVDLVVHMQIFVGEMLAVWSADPGMQRCIADALQIPVFSPQTESFWGLDAPVSIQIQR